MAHTSTKIDIEQLRIGVRKVFAAFPTPTSDSKNRPKHIQRKDRQASSVKEPKGSYKTAKP